MKFFSRFLTEAESSKVADQARRKGLKSDGHGGWLDRTGKYVAKTEKGKLRFFGTRGPGQDDQPAGRKPAAAQPTAQKKVQSPVAIMAKKRADDDLAGAPLQKKEEEGGEEKGDNPITIAFGRFNPPTIGHGKLLDAAKKAAAGGEMKIYPSRSQDDKKNPLDPDMKVSYMKKLFPDYKENIINDSEMKTIFDVLTTANEDGFRNVNIIVGADRQAEFENLATKYNGDLYDFDTIRVISAGVRDADAEGVEGMSASKMRKAVVDGDYNAFKRGLPKGTKDADTQAVYDAVRTGMKIKKSAEAKKAVQKELWQIAPRFDQKGLREQYVTGKLFRIGDRVESLNTGLIGKIIRRGTNHLICVTEEDYMFKSWIKDLKEYSESPKYGNDSMYRAPGKPNTLVGTGGFLKYARSMVPGQVPDLKKKKKMNIKEFINKYKIKK